MMFPLSARKPFGGHLVLPIGNCILAAIDAQEKLLAVVPGRDDIISAIALLIDAARILDGRIECTEQYPRGLGITVAELAERLPTRRAKTTFSALGVEAISSSIPSGSHVVLCGLETHVCIRQTAVELLALGHRVSIVVDAVGCRFPLDGEVALRQLQHDGAILTTAEAVVFDWLGSADHPAFRSISKLVKQRVRPALRNS